MSERESFREVYPALDETLAFYLSIEAYEIRAQDQDFLVSSAYQSPNAQRHPPTALPKITPPPFYLPVGSELRMHIERGRLVVEIFKRA
jgi:hypothetical protein